MEFLTELMEALMVICFGISWPLNIVKAWKARTAKGTSLLFYFFIWIGYIFALIGKTVGIIYLERPFTYPIIFYVLNVIMVTGGILIYFRNKILDRKNGVEEPKKEKKEKKSKKDKE